MLPRPPVAYLIFQAYHYPGEFNDPEGRVEVNPGFQYRLLETKQEVPNEQTICGCVGWGGVCFLTSFLETVISV
jgi:hypothetical protein